MVADWGDSRSDLLLVDGASGAPVVVLRTGQAAEGVLFRFWLRRSAASQMVAGRCEPQAAANAVFQSFSRGQFLGSCRMIR
jgi:hypothetical protein